MKHLYGIEAFFSFILVGFILWFMLNSSEVAFKQKFYPAAVALASSKADYDTKYMDSKSTEHFRIKYEPEDEAMVPLIAETAEQAYRSLAKLWQAQLPKTITIVVYSDRQKMAQGLNWKNGESAMGTYYGGQIQVLSPKAWLKPDHYSDFATQGPLLHELTHMMLDYEVKGNYSRWYTEGLAQYSEYRVNGFEWKTKTNDLSRFSLYTMADLDQKFDDLPDQSLAYREAFGAVRYLAEVYGEKSLAEINQSLKQGRKLSQAIESVTGHSYSQFEQDWQTWAKQNLK